VPISRDLTWATRGSLGFLWPTNYGAAVREPASTFEPPSAALTRDYQLTFFRGLFSGGPSSNRGYPFRGISPHALIPAVAPESQISALNTACEDCRVPAGGFSLWEASTELRYDVSGPISAVAFCDASDVSPHTNDIRVRHPHLSCGAGARYDTPVGAIRLDVGYRIPRLQVIGGLTPDEQEPDTFPFGIPIAIAIGIGEAY
jgi:outer membrane protein insertion porin family/translocation and assembly module TamA